MTTSTTVPLHVTYEVQLLPRRRHHRRLQETLDTCRNLYNAAHEERLANHRRFLRDEWIPAETRKAAGLKRTKRRNPAPTLYDQMKALTDIRSSDEPTRSVGVSLTRGTLAMLDAAWMAIGAKDTLGRTRKPPHFKARHRDHALNFHDPKAVRLRDGYLIAKPIGAIRYRAHRELPDGKPVAVRLCRDDRAGDLRDNQGGRWRAKLTYLVKFPATRRRRRRLDGLDLGLAEYVTGSRGTVLEALRPGRAADAERRCLQRKLRYRRAKTGKPRRAMSKRGGHGRRKLVKRLRRLEARATRQRLTRARRAAARVTQANDGVAVENPRSLAGLYQTHNARSVYDAGWAIFRNALAWMCRKANIPLVTVPAAGTSQDCPACLAKKAFSNNLKERWRECACGWKASRDVTSGCEILRRGVPELVKRGGGRPAGP